MKNVNLNLLGETVVEAGNAIILLLFRFSPASLTVVLFTSIFFSNGNEMSFVAIFITTFTSIIV